MHLRVHIERSVGGMVRYNPPVSYALRLQDDAEYFRRTETMPQSTDPLAPLEIRPFLQAVVSLMDSPAAIVADGEEVLAYNGSWRHRTRSTHESDDAEKPLAFEYSLKDYSNAEMLIAKLKGRSRGDGMFITRHDAGQPATGAMPNKFEVRWRQIQIPSQQHAIAIVTLHAIPEASPATTTIMSQQARIEHLLVHQTLIEEAERRRLGRALHDVVVQDLALVRSAVRASGISAAESAKMVTSLDRIINEVRTLTFDLGPPILDDLGLCPAIQWLAEHLNQRYGSNIAIAHDECEPQLSKATRTIVFRAVRELAINAIKHAPGAEIVISCVSNHSFVRILIRDTGPGFDTTGKCFEGGNIHHYGLLSVEQQIRGVGGSFSIVSEIGDGTRATIIIPLEADHGVQHE